MEAIEWAVNKNADIISISLGYKFIGWDLRDGSSHCSKLINKVVDNNVLVVIAAGNEGKEGISVPGDAEFVLFIYYYTRH